MRAAIAILALVISACGTAEAVVEPLPGPLPVPDVPVPSPPAPTPLPEVPPPEPPAPPPPPRGTIHSQSVYPAPDLTEWRLPNGAVVVFKPVPEAEGFALRAFAKGGWMSLDPRDADEARSLIASSTTTDALTPVLTATERRIEGQSSDLEALVREIDAVFAGRQQVAESPPTAVDALDPIDSFELATDDASSGERVPVRVETVFADPGAFTFILVGPSEADHVASVIGRHLTPLRASQGLDFGSTRRSEGERVRRAGSGERGVLDLAIRISARPSDVAPLAVLRGALDATLHRAELGRLRVEFGTSPWVDAAWLRVWVEASALSPDALEVAIRDALSGDVLIVTSARRRLLRELQTPTPMHWLDAVADLYREGGGRQPARDPASLVPLAGPIARVTDSDVLTLARRFAVSTDTAVILTP